MNNIIGLSKYKKDQASEICLGVFDGFHKGHQTLMNNAQYMVTFYPHPKSILKNQSIQLLTTLKEQSYFNKNRIVIPFTNQIAKMTASDFLNQIINRYLSPTKIVVGYDFKFGCNQQGTPSLLENWGKKNNCTIVVIPKQTASDGTPFKSSIIKNEFSNNFNKAIKLLGHPYLIIGKVIKGENRGKSLGFPTANIQVPTNKFIPKKGVYKGTIQVNQNTYNGIIYIGNKPTFKSNLFSIEAHILDPFNKSIYGKYPKIFLTKFIRDEQKFNSQNDLIQQIKKDIQA